MDNIIDYREQKSKVALSIAYEFGDCPNVVEKVSADEDDIWHNVIIRKNHKLQKNKLFDYYRILNQNNERIAWGSMAVMTEKFNRLTSDNFFKYGDIVGVVRRWGLYEHYCVYKNDDCVIEYAGDEGHFGKNVNVRRSSFEQFLRKDASNYFALLFDGTGRSPKKVFVNPVKVNENELIHRIELNDYITLYSPAETVKRAEERLGEKKYNLVWNNCECFALWCKTGENKSYQVNRVISGLIEIGPVGLTFANAFKGGTVKPLMIQLVKEVL